MGRLGGPHNSCAPWEAWFTFFSRADFITFQAGPFNVTESGIPKSSTSNSNLDSSVISRMTFDGTNPEKACIGRGLTRICGAR